MAHTIARNIGTTAQRGPVSKALYAAFAALVRLSEANVRVQKINDLWSLSDDELAKRGLKRQDIVQHVMVGKDL